MIRTRKGFFVTALGVLVFLSAVVSGALTTRAADGGPLQLTLLPYRVVTTDDDSEQLVPFEGKGGVPGDVLEYQLRAKNTGEEGLHDIVVRLPVPEGSRYVHGSEQLDPTAVLLQFSIDGGQAFRTPPIRYTITRDDGTPVQATAGADMYTDLRLVFLRPLVAGEEVSFQYRVEIE